MGGWAGSFHESLFQVLAVWASSSNTACARAMCIRMYRCSFPRTSRFYRPFSLPYSVCILWCSFLCAIAYSCQSACHFHFEWQTCKRVNMERLIKLMINQFWWSEGVVGGPKTSQKHPDTPNILFPPNFGSFLDHSRTSFWMSSCHRFCCCRRLGRLLLVLVVASFLS